MTDIDKLKELAVPVSERLPEKEKHYIVIFIFDNKEQTGHAYLDTWGSNERLFWVVRGAFIGEEPVVTHWIDFSLLAKKPKITFEQCLREEFLINTQNYPKEYHNLFAEKFKRAENRLLTENQSKL